MKIAEKIWHKKRISKAIVDQLEFSHIENYETMKPRQIIWHLMNNIDKIPTCLECNNKVNWFRRKYYSHCSLKCSTNSNKTKTKIRKTSLKKYNNEHHSKSKDFRNRLRSLWAKKSQYEIDEIIQKYKQNYFKKYGINHYTQAHFSTEQKEILFNKSKFIEFCHDKTIMEISRELQIDRTTVDEYAKKYNVEIDRKTSYLESEMAKFLQEQNVDFIQNTRKIISPLELDFYLPDHNLAIEMNGDYWHSDEHISKKYGITASEYHQKKTNLCQERGIVLIHISETDWYINQEEYKNSIMESINAH